MKRVFILALSLLACCAVLPAQNYNKKEVKSLQQFLNQPSAKEKPNYALFKRTNLNDPSTWEGVTWENGHVTVIDWRGRGLAGDLSLDNFTQLQRVDVTANQLTTLSASGCKALTNIEAGRNKLTGINLSGCTALRTLNCFKNRLSDIDLSSSMGIVSLNCADNLFVAHAARCLNPLSVAPPNGSLPSASFYFGTGLRLGAYLRLHC